jgi:hypothetical protein
MVIHHGKVINREHLLKPPAKPWTHALLDDFANADLVSALGGKWDRNLDSDVGGKSTMQHEYRDGMLRVWGKLQPASNIPGLAGFSLSFDRQNTPFDVSTFKGLRVRIKNAAGPLFLKILTASVTNYDYPAVIISNAPDFQEIELPFAQFKQFWSAPIPWTGKDVHGVALWVSGFQPADFEFAVDMLEFY